MSIIERYPWLKGLVKLCGQVPELAKQLAYVVMRLALRGQVIEVYESVECIHVIFLGNITSVKLNLFIGPCSTQCGWLGALIFNVLDYLPESLLERLVVSHQ